jgi:hypothetical protein
LSHDLLGPGEDGLRVVAKPDRLVAQDPSPHLRVNRSQEDHAALVLLIGPHNPTVLRKRERESRGDGSLK